MSSTNPLAYDEAALLEAMRGHWSAIENGSHHRRDVSMGEDASGISKRTQAHMMASLRNLIPGAGTTEKHRRAGNESSSSKSKRDSRVTQSLCQFR